MGVRSWCDRRVGPVSERYCRGVQYWALWLGAGCTGYTVHVYCGTGSLLGPGRGLGHLTPLGRMRMGAAVSLFSRSALSIDTPAIPGGTSPFSTRGREAGLCRYWAPGHGALSVVGKAAAESGCSSPPRLQQPLEGRYKTGGKGVLHAR